MTAFPLAPLGQKCELLLNGTWTDVTSYTVHEQAGGGGTAPAVVTITRGRADEMTTSPTASQAVFRCANDDGRFTARNPTGPYYPYLARGTQCRWSVPASSTYLRLETDNQSSATCPDAVGLHIAGDLDVRVDVQLSGWASGILAGKWVHGGTGNSWLLVLNADGTVTLFWSTTGSDFPSFQSQVPLIPQVTATQRFSVRATLQVNNGAGGHTAAFYTGPAGGADGSSWTQLGPAVVASGTTSINAGTAGIAAGNYTPGGGSDGIAGSVFELEARSGIAGTVVAHPVFSSQTAGATSFSDAQGNTWSVNGAAELSGRDYRFHGQLSSLPVTWGPTGQDAWAPLTASGVLRRLGQGSTPVSSAMKRAVLSQSGTLAPVAYWPCEDTPGATVIASGLSGGSAMTMTGGTGDGTVSKTGADFSADSSFACSLALPQFAGSAWLGTVPSYTSNGSLIVRFLMDISTAPVDTARLIRVITTGTCKELVLIYHTSGGLEIAGFGSSGAGVFTSGNIAFGALASPMWVSLELRPGGGSTVDWSLETLTPGASAALGTSGTFSGTIGNATQVQPGPTQLLSQVAMGHISVQSDWASLFSLASPLDAWKGETAASRFARLCSENGVTSRIIGPPSTSVAMGNQAADTLLNLLQACEDADQGQAHEPREVLGLAYRTSASMCDQAAAVTLDYSAGQLAPPLSPTDDDQRTANDVTVTADDGSSAVATLNDGTTMSISVAGDYSASASASLSSDSQLPDAAGWRLHIGTVDEERFPGISVNLADTALASVAAAVRGVGIGDYVAVSNPPSFLAPGTIRQLAWGSTETLGDFCSMVTWNGVPESPWETAIADDLVLGHADTDGSTLHAGITSAATSMQVDTTSSTSQPWTTSAGDFPFDVLMGGEQITVTAVSGSSSPQTWTVTRSVNGVVKAHSAGEAVLLAHGAMLALV